jgi:IclR family KDG regulon transcriptional repressor
LVAPLSSIKKALKILQIFSTDRPELRVTDISKTLNAHKSSVSRIVSTLASEGFLEKNSGNNKYRLGRKLLDLGYQVLDHYDIRDHARPFMEKLARNTNEIVHLSILDKNEIIYLDKIGEGQVLTVATKVGAKHPAYACAMGKVLLSELRPGDLTQILSLSPLVKFTAKTIAEVPKLLRELEKVKEQGFAIDDEERFLGIRCVAAPIRNRKREIVAAISTTVPKQRMGPQRIDAMRKLVVETAHLISERVQ